MEQLIKEATLPTIIYILSGVFAAVMLAIALAIFSNYVIYDDEGKKKIIKGMKKEKKACCCFFYSISFIRFSFWPQFPNYM